MRRLGSQTALMLVSVLALAGCVAPYPADPNGTLERVTDGTLRVGASENGGWVHFAGPGSADTGTPEPGGQDTGGTGPLLDEFVQGTDADLVRDFAARLGADVDWVSGAEHVLAEELKHGQLDLVIGGLDDHTPWTRHGGLTRVYAESRDSRGTLHRHVMLVPLGENAFLLELDRFLMDSRDKA